MDIGDPTKDPVRRCGPYSWSLGWTEAAGCGPAHSYAAASLDRNSWPVHRFDRVSHHARHPAFFHSRLRDVFLLGLGGSLGV